MYGSFQSHITTQIDEIRRNGLYKSERVISTPQGTYVRVADGKPVLNMCANNYLGLAQHPEIREAARRGLDEWGYGCASVRFICGTQGIHKQLEARLSSFLGTEDTILYSSCFDANGGLFETLLGAEDAVISDELNHASIIDGVRLCKAQRYRYKNNDMSDLEAQLSACHKAEKRLQAVAARYGNEVVLIAMDELLDRSERMTRAEIAALPDGDYSFEDFLDNDGMNGPPQRLCATLLSIRYPARARHHAPYPQGVIPAKVGTHDHNRQ